MTGNTIWICVVASYILFLHFIRTQAREALRIQNELNLAHGIQQTLVPPVSLSTTAFEVYGWLGAMQESLVRAIWR